MPYVFAHPAAAVPLHRLLGRLAVPSALVIGSVAPDLWLVVPFVEREQTHAIAAIVWFSLPLGMVLYAAFHLVFKEPLLALLPQRLARALSAWTCRSLPRASALAVVASIAAGAGSHLAWDALTHRRFDFLDGTVHLAQVLQHGSTVAGTLFLAWWTARKLAASPASSGALARRGWPGVIVAGLVAISAALFALVTVPALPAMPDVASLRLLLRGAAALSGSAFGLALLAYCIVWRIAGASLAHLPGA